MIGRRNKFNARRTEADARTFDSKREAAVYLELKARHEAGEIGQIEFQPQFPLAFNGIKITSRPYRADFRFLERATGEWRVLDVKGIDTREGRLRRRLAEVLHGVIVEVVK